MSFDDIKITIIVTTLLILLLIAGVIITIFISNRRNAAQEIKMTQMALGYAKELRTVQHEMQEQVLSNISAELHDNIGQLLTFMHMQLEQNKMQRPEIREFLNPTHDTLKTAMQQVRSLAKSMNSEMLDQVGLLNMIQLEVTRLQQLNHLTVHWKTDDAEPRLDKDQKLMSFRIFQEIMNNALKHSEAKNIYVSMKGAGRFEFEIRDDGKGFDVKRELREGKGSGLRNIIKRAGLADLSCNIVAEKGKGSIFTLAQNIKVSA